jgi:hypothetical protein
MKKVLPNRISKSVAPDALDNARKGVALIQRALGTPTAISETDYQSLRKVGTKLKQEADEVFALAQANPELTEEPFSLAEMSKDKGFAELCAAIKSMLAPLNLQADREQTIAEAEYLNGCSLFEENVALKTERGHSKAQYIQVQLNRIDRFRGGGKKSKSKNNPKTDLPS